MRAYDAIVKAAIRWRTNVLECRYLAASLEPCDLEPDPVDSEGDYRPPCWKYYEHDPSDPYGGPVQPTFCGACQRNAEHVVPRLKEARARRGGLTSVLARAVDRFCAEAETEESG